MPRGGRDPQQVGLHRNLSLSIKAIATGLGALKDSEYSLDTLRLASPARGTLFAPGQPWVIVTINQLAAEADAALWAGLNHNMTLSAGLRAELSR